MKDRRMGREGAGVDGVRHGPKAQASQALQYISTCQFWNLFKTSKANKCSRKLKCTSAYAGDELLC